VGLNGRLQPLPSVGLDRLGQPVFSEAHITIDLSTGRGSYNVSNPPTGLSIVGGVLTQVFP